MTTSHTPQWREGGKRPKSLDQIALERAIRAVRRADRKTDHFDNGNYTSWEMVDTVIDELRAEFAALSKARGEK